MAIGYRLSSGQLQWHLLWRGNRPMAKAVLCNESSLVNESICRQPASGPIWLSPHLSSQKTILNGIYCWPAIEAAQWPSSAVYGVSMANGNGWLAYGWQPGGGNGCGSRLP